jgi:hypothetical protein
MLYFGAYEHQNNALHFSSFGVQNATHELIWLNLGAK